tara:strand:+ start:1329 stop:2645 length:1317 start_codon:yes stop_codon:yes gene_type:complete
MDEWNIKDLEEWDKKICELGESYGLDWFDIDYEIIDYHEMIGAMSYVGMPTHYRHWSFGKLFEITHAKYTMGQTGLPYEMIINSNPSIAYLMKENPMSTHLLTMSHCVGHSDFFKNNRMFKHTDPDNVISKFKLGSKRIQQYLEDPSIGVNKVERIIDACHAIKYQIPRTPGIKRRSQEELKGIYVQKMLDSTDGIFDDIDLDKFPLERDYNLLAFIRENSRNLKDWERDVISIVEENSKYFLPQAYTKIMNEGWAVMMHEKIMKDLNLPHAYHLAFIKLHNQVVRPHLGGVNPYHLGYTIFKKIEEEKGFDECLMVREVHNDVTFLRKYLDEQLARDLNLFAFSYKKKQNVHTIDDVSNEDGWENVRDALISTVGLNSVPVVYVEELMKDNSLHIVHDHDGRDLNLQHGHKVYDHIKELWGDNVIFTTIIEEELWEF